MIDLHYWPTPNGHKITLFLEEAGLDYTVHPVDIGKGEQFAPDFLAFSPNNRMPAIVDHAPADGGEPITVLDRRLAGRDFITGEYSIADMACYPWIAPHEGQGQSLDDFPNVKRWFDAIAARPATIAAYARGAAIQAAPPEMTDEQRKILFGQP